MMYSSWKVKFASDEVIDVFLANVDVWQAIFEMLSVKDRIRLEMTNKRFRSLMCASWKGLTSFDTECFTEISYNPSMSSNREMLSAAKGIPPLFSTCSQRIEPILRRRGGISLLQELGLDGYKPSMNKNCNKRTLKRSAASVAICIDRIGAGLRSLTIREKCIPATAWSANLRSIAKGCPNVETINFVFHGGARDVITALRYRRLAFAVRFDPFSRLKTLTVSTEHEVLAETSASVFLSIPVSIEVIRGLYGKSEAVFENAAQVEGFFADRPSLREVYLGDLNTHDKSNADIFRVIAERCPHLKSIKVSCKSYRMPINSDPINCIDYRGVIALESMKELRIRWATVDEMELVTICKRSPLVEALEFQLRFSSDLDLQSEALNALGALTNLRHLGLYFPRSLKVVVVPSLVTDFARELAQHSGTSLRRLDLWAEMPLPTQAIEALANGCGKLRRVMFWVRVGEATPASIRFLIDCIVAHPSWILQTDQPTLLIKIYLIRDRGEETKAGRAAFKALAAPAANLPAGVDLDIS